MQFAIQTIVNGILLGAVFMLIALGFAVVYSVLRMFNFAHGDTYMVGVFAMLSLMLTGLPAPLAILAGMAVAAVLAVVIERFGYRRFRGHPMMGILSAVAIALVLRQVVELIWGVGTRSFPQAFPRPLFIGGVTVTETQIVTLAVGIGAAVVIGIFLRRTRWGRAVLLVRQDMEVAQLMGISVNRVISMVYAIAGVLGAVGGYLFATTYGVVDSTFGFQQTVTAFIAAVLGGIGGLGGAVVGGLALGIVEQFAAAYLNSSYQIAVAFGVLAVFLLFRPYGILGTTVEGERV